MFNRKNLFKNIEKNKDCIINSEFLNFIRQDIVDRLMMLSNNFDRILVIRDHGKYISNSLARSSKPREIFEIEDEESLSSPQNSLLIQDLEKNKLDLIVFPFGLHFTNNVQSFLASCRKLLNDDGVLICNFAAAGSLVNLRKIFIKIEEDLSYPHVSRMAPLIKFDDVALLLNQAGFREVIIDAEKLDLEFPTALELIKAIKNTANSNVMENRGEYAITKEFYKSIRSSSDSRKNSFFSESSEGEKFIDNINLSSFICCPKKGGVKLKKIN